VHKNMVEVDAISDGAYKDEFTAAEIRQYPCDAVDETSQHSSEISICKYERDCVGCCNFLFI
jgi:hypothetical protein